MWEENVVEKRVYCWIWGESHIADGGKTWRGKTVDTNHARTKTTTTKRNPLLDGCPRRATCRRRRCCAACTVEWASRLPNQRSRLRIPLYLREKQPFGSNNAFVWISFFKCIICNRYLLRFFDCVAHPNLTATFATDQKLPISHLRISSQFLAGSLRSLKKSGFLKLIILIFHEKKLTN